MTTRDLINAKLDRDLIILFACFEKLPIRVYKAICNLYLSKKPVNKHVGYLKKVFPQTYLLLVSHIQGPAISQAMNRRDNLLDQARLIKLNIILPVDETYPVCLQNVVSPPRIIVTKGNVEVLKAHRLGIVGTRKATLYGLNITKKLVKYISSYKIATVSGLARGIDAMVHRSSIDCKTPTIAVLPGPVWEISPKANKDLSEDILSSGGLLVSEQTSNKVYAKSMYALRNRIIAGLAESLVVIEAGEKSGALITAKHAFANNREVFALVGDIDRVNLLGNFNLIKSTRAGILTGDFNNVLESILKAKELAEVRQYPTSIVDTEVNNELRDQALAIVDLLSKNNLALEDICTEMPDSSNVDIMTTCMRLVADGILEQDTFGRFGINV